MKHHEAVRGHVAASVLRARSDETAGAVLARLAHEKPASVELVLVVDDHGKLKGVVPLGRLFAAPAATPLKEILDSKFPRVTADTDQEHAASLALHHGVDALPVVDDAGRALGVMPSQALLQVLRREHVEDLHRLAGIQHEAAQARHAIEDPPLRRVRHRLPWLLVGLAGSALATAAMASFEVHLERNDRGRVLRARDRLPRRRHRHADRGDRGAPALAHSCRHRAAARGRAAHRHAARRNPRPRQLCSGVARVRRSAARGGGGHSDPRRGYHGGRPRARPAVVDRAQRPRPRVRQRPARNRDPGHPEPFRLSGRGARLRRLIDTPGPAPSRAG